MPTPRRRRSSRAASTTCYSPTRSRRTRRIMSERDVTLIARPEVRHQPIESSAFGVVEKPLSTFERIYNIGAVRKAAILIALALIWEIGARLLNNELLFPTFIATNVAFFQGVMSGEILARIGTSLRVLVMGY